MKIIEKIKFLANNFFFADIDEIEKYKNLLASKVKSNKIDEELNDLIMNKLEYYIYSSSKGKRNYNFFNIVIILLGLIITYLSSLSSSMEDRIITLLSLLVTGSSSILIFMDYKTRWLRYRIIAEGIEKEIRSFSIDKDMDKKIFVDNIEKVIGSDVDKFTKYVKNKKDEKHN